ncbi:glycosyltransferase family 4 protein [Vulcanisaeta thermophila]|uniref:glycosyltransferase family 4 protein n=1 Tax=Vulcanisaeta thermophila TaxID=867917 RepID=UPI000853072C|nr:glycosyltransferase family 4 protein [Vulcanisaeta thermophila]
MRTLIVTAEYPPYTFGGVGTFAYELAQGLKALGHDVHVVSRSHSLNTINSTNVRLLLSPPIPPKDLWFYSLRGMDMMKVVKELKPDIIHDASGITGYLPWITRYAPTVVTVHGTPMLGRIRILMGGEDKIRSILFDISHSIPARLISIFTKPQVKRVVFVSKAALWDSVKNMDNKTKGEFLKRARVVYNGVNIRWLRKIQSEVEPEDYRVSFIARLMEYKGVRWLIKAFRHVVNEIPNAKLDIVGDGPLFNEMRKLIEKLDLKNNVIMHGSLPREREQ